MVRRTRKAWYQYHMQRSIQDARSPVDQRYRGILAAEAISLSRIQAMLCEIDKNEPMLSKFVGLLGIRTEYRLTQRVPLEAAFFKQVARQAEIVQRWQQDAQQATLQGANNYKDSHSARIVEQAERVERVLERKFQRRVSYLERSPAIRSAARFLKSLLVKEAADPAMQISCYYCGISIHASASHLEHKRPVSRGGGNTRGNLVLSCPKCNLKKGRKTHEEFLKLLGKNAP